jgi:hypothetical protein
VETMYCFLGRIWLPASETVVHAAGLNY